MMKDNPSRFNALIEESQYLAMKQLAFQICDPTEKYDELIRRVHVRFFGEENYKNFQGQVIGRAALL